MDLLPDLRTLSNEDLDRLIHELTQEENDVSFERRRVQGYLDILRAERTARMKGESFASPPVEQLAAILTGKGLLPDVRTDTA
jgi:RsiG-like